MYLCLLTEAWFLFLTTSRWFAVRLDGICSIFVTITAFGCLYLRDGTEWALDTCIHVTHYWHFSQYMNLLWWNNECFPVCLLFKNITGLEPGAVGLALSYAVTLTGMFQWGVRQSAEIENMVRTLKSEHLNAVYILVGHHKIHSWFLL